MFKFIKNENTNLKVGDKILILFNSIMVSGTLFSLGMAMTQMHGLVYLIDGVGLCALGVINSLIIGTALIRQ